MSVATMSRWTKRAYLELYHEKRRKKESGPKNGLTVLINMNVLNQWQFKYQKN